MWISGVRLRSIPPGVSIGGFRVHPRVVSVTLFAPILYVVSSIPTKMNGEFELANPDKL